jgi:hypothetical protein
LLKKGKKMSGTTGLVRRNADGSIIKGKDDNDKNRRQRCGGGGLALVLLIILFIFVGIAAFVIALVFGIHNQHSIDGINRELDDIEDTLIRHNETIETVRILSTPPAINGWLAFWWVSSGNRHEWARFNETTGALIGNYIPYSPSETRQSSPPGKSQFSRGPGPNEMAYLIWSEVTLDRYLVRHNTQLGTFLRTDLGPDPLNHQNPEVLVYDPLHLRYVGAAPITTQSNRYGIVVIDENTGVVTPLTGETGVLPPLAPSGPTNQALDLEIIADKILFFDRWDDNLALVGHIIFYNSSDGGYLSESFFNGTIIPYPGTFLPTFITFNQRFWYISAGYDRTTFRLNLVITTVSAGHNRGFAWIQGSSEADLLQKLESGNYDIHITQFMPPFQLNAGVFINA